MKCLDDCHSYELETFMKDVDTIHEHGRKFLRFYELKENGDRIDGVTNEEVIRVLIHRLTFLNEKWQDGKFRCRENSIAITRLEEALMWLEKRTADRVARNVEGTHEK